MKNLYIIILVFIILSSISFAEAQDNKNFEALKKKIEPAMSLSIEELQMAISIKVHMKYDGASIIASDNENTYLGKIDNPYAMDSIFNSVGKYGSSVAMDSIWNSVGMFGSEVGMYSPFNSVSSSPPLIIKNGRVIGVLTVNEILDGAVDPNWLKSYYK